MHQKKNLLCGIQTFDHLLTSKYIQLPVPLNQRIDSLTQFLKLYLLLRSRYVPICYIYFYRLLSEGKMLWSSAHSLSTLFQLLGIEVLASIGKITIKAHLIAVTADLPARAMIANMKQFNGKFGCSFCLDEGESRPNCPMHRFWPYKESSELRTHQSYIDNLTEAVQSNKTVSLT